MTPVPATPPRGAPGDARPAPAGATTAPRPTERAQAATVPHQAIVLCAGEGRRLRPVTEELPKPLVPFLNVPLLRHALGGLAAAGVRRVALNAFHLGSALERFAHSAADCGLDLHVRHESVLLGTGGALSNLRDWLEPGAVLVLAGDIFAEIDYPALAARHAQAGALATMALTSRASPALFGPVEVDEQGLLCDIVGLVGRPGVQAFVNASAHLLEPDFVDRLPREACCLVRQGYVPALRAGGTIAGCVQAGAWAELGTPAGFLEATRAALAGDLPVDPALLAAAGHRDGLESLVHPTAAIGRGVRLADGTVVGPQARVGDGAELLNCVLLPGARVEPGTRLARTIVTGSGRVAR